MKCEYYINIGANASSSAGCITRNISCQPISVQLFAWYFTHHYFSLIGVARNKITISTKRPADGRLTAGPANRIIFPPRICAPCLFKVPCEFLIITARGGADSSQRSSGPTLRVLSTSQGLDSGHEYILRVSLTSSHSAAAVCARCVGWLVCATTHNENTPKSLKWARKWLMQWARHAALYIFECLSVGREYEKRPDFIFGMLA